MADQAGKTFSFGKSSPRALDSFGVAGILLGTKSKVFYSSIFTTKHIGRVTDLIAAKLGEEGLDELRLRALVLFSSFEVFRSQSATPEAASKHRLAEPLVVECGLDAEKVVIGVSYTPDEERFPKLEGLSERIEQGSPSDGFEALLAEIHAQSDRAILRAQAGTRRVEIVALLAIPGKLDAGGREPLHVVQIPGEQKANPPKVDAYVELGDLDYGKLLKEDDKAKGDEGPATGEVLVHGLQDADEVANLRGEKLREEIANHVKGGDEINDGLVRVAGKGEKPGEGGFTLSNGSSEGDTSGGAVLIKGSQQPEIGYKLKKIEIPRMPAASASESGEQADAKDLESTESESDADDTIEEAKALVRKKAKKKAPHADAVPQEPDEEDEGDDEAAEPPVRSVFSKVKSAWRIRFGLGKSNEDEAAAAEEPSVDDGADTDDEPTPEELVTGQPKKKKKKSSLVGVDAGEAMEEESEGESEEESAKPAAKTEPQAEKKSDSDAAVTPAAPPATQAIKISTADIQKEAQKLTAEIETGIQKTVDRAQSEANDVKKEMGSARAKRWVDGLMTELVAEKAALAEASKALNTSIRQKELEFRMKEQMLTEELKRRDDLIRQKTNALERLKDQLSQAAISAERLKSAKGGGADDVHYKQKYTLVQKMLNSAKDENKELVDKIDDLKNQLMNAQSNSKRNQPSMQDFTALQTKYERAIRQGDEFKKANQQLMDKLGEVKKERVMGPQDETKKRLEAAMKIAAGHQKESEKLQQRVEDMQREQMRLQAELNKANQDLKSARLGKAPAPAAQAGVPGPAAKPGAPAAAAKPGTPAGARPGVATSAARPAAPGASAAAKPAAPAAVKPGAGGKTNPPKAA